MSEVKEFGTPLTDWFKKTIQPSLDEIEKLDIEEICEEDDDNQK